MDHYVIVDGVLQRSSPGTKLWASRAAKTVARYDPNFEEAERDARMEALDEERATRQSDYEILRDLEEIE
jgi:hypothetical protein